MKKMLKVYLVLIAFFAFAFAGMAQVTTSGISGKVTDANNEPLPGATIIAVHQPTGTQYGSITNEKGRYFSQGMRVGGPYKIIISFVGYNKMEFDNVQLSLGDPLTLNATLKEDVKELSEVVVSAVAGVKKCSRRCCQ